MVRIARNIDSRVLAEMAVQMWDSNTVDELEAEFVETLNDKQSAFFIKYINDLPVADIQENADKLTNELNHMTDELQDLNTAVEAANQDINRVKSKSGVTDISFVRSICRKLAIPTDKLANQIKMHNAEIANYWKIIENSYLSLLDNKYARTPDNLKGLRDSVSQLRNMQLSIKGSNEKIESFVAVLKTTMGIERKLNQAVTALITEFEAYLRQTDTMHSSIDRIISKSNLVTGN